MTGPALSSIELMHAMDHHPFSDGGWIFELKYDGYRVLASKAQLLTRQKKDATTWYPQIVVELKKLRGSFILDGEVCLLDERGVPNFEGMRRRRGEGFTYCAFDLLFHNGRDLRSLPLLERKERLRKLIPANSPALLYVGYIEENGLELFKLAVATGMEGIIAKRADSAYTGGRSRAWLKGKQSGFHDGWERPTRKEPK
jgi:bifunctional non-homologous end joining protein LigD